MAFERPSSTSASSLVGSASNIPAKWRLSAPVGVGQPNRRQDVLLVQRLLNRSRGNDPTINILPETGLFDATTATWLRRFQRDFAHLRKPDAVIGVRGPTQRSLHRLTSSNGSPSPEELNEAAGNAVVSDDAAVEPNGNLQQLLLMKAASPKNPRKKAFFGRIIVPAAQAKLRWGTPICITIAQAALESEWGSKAPGNNFFGIKGTSPNGRSQTFATHEEVGGRLKPQSATFRAYASLDESVDDYGRFLRSNPRYSPAFAWANDPFKFLHELCVAGYATLGAYEARVKSVVLFNGLMDFDRVRLAFSPFYMDAVSIGGNLT